MGKPVIWTMLCFSLLTPLKSDEEQPKLVLRNVISSQHCIRGEVEF